MSSCTRMELSRMRSMPAMVSLTALPPSWATSKESLGGFGHRSAVEATSSTAVTMLRITSTVLATRSAWFWAPSAILEMAARSSSMLLELSWAALGLGGCALRELLHDLRDAVAGRGSLRAVVLQLGGGRSQHAAGIGNLADEAPQVFHHGVDGRTQLADFIMRGDLHLLTEIPFGHLLRQGQHAGHRAGDGPGKQDAHHDHHHEAEDPDGQHPGSQGPDWGEGFVFLDLGDEHPVQMVQDGDGGVGTEDAAPAVIHQQLGAGFACLGRTDGGRVHPLGQRGAGFGEAGIAAHQLVWAHQVGLARGAQPGGGLHQQVHRRDGQLENDDGRIAAFSQGQAVGDKADDLPARGFKRSKIGQGPRPLGGEDPAGGFSEVGLGHGPSRTF